MPTIDTKTSGITQARVRDNDDGGRVLKQGCTVGDCKSDDDTPAPTPQLLRAICFDQGKPDAQIVPQPPPQQSYWSSRPRDPTLIELGNVEIGSHMEFVSLSDNPAANFDKDGDVRRLDFTGYDVGQRKGTVALNPEEMANEGFKPGERLIMRAVDKNGNASDGIFVYLDPNGWANQQVQQTNDDGSARVQLRGANIQFADGETGLPGATGAMKNLIGTATRDTDAPKLLEKNVSLKTFTYNKEDFDTATAIMNNPTRNFIYQKLRTTQFSEDQAKQLVAMPDCPPEAKKALGELLEDDGKMFKKLDNANDPSSQKDGIIGDADFQRVQQLGPNGRDVYLNIDKALEPGVSFSLQNSRTGQLTNSSLQANQRTALVRLNGENKDGDPMILTFQDASGNQGKPYAMEYSSTCADGKASYNPLSVRFPGSTVGGPSKAGTG